MASFHQHHSTFTLQTYHHPEHRFRSWTTQMTSTSHLHTQVRVQPRNTYNHTYIKFLPGQNKQSHTKSIQNNLQSVHCTNHGNTPKGSGPYLRPKLTNSIHIHISVEAHKPLQMIKALTATGWGKQKETLMVTYKAVMGPALEYASSIWSPLAS